MIETCFAILSALFVIYVCLGIPCAVGADNLYAGLCWPLVVLIRSYQYLREVWFDRRR